VPRKGGKAKVHPGGQCLVLGYLAGSKMNFPL
jgi:hypothetical protein